MSRIAAAASIAVVLGLACASKKAAAPDAASPADAAAGMGDPGDDIDALERDLERYEARLQMEEAYRDKTELEGEDAGGQPEPGTPAGVAPDRCARICELTESICELESRICTLAGEHDGETRYAEACERAGRNCARGREACSACCG